MSKTKNNSTEKETENFTTVWDSVRRAKTVNGIQFKPIDKLLYSYLLGWQVSKDDPNNKKVTKVNSSVRELQQELGVSKGTVETSLKTLEKMGLIVIKSGGVGFSNEYDVIKFSDVESTNVEIKVDQFMKDRKEWREQHSQKTVKPVVKPVEQTKPKEPEPVSKQDDLPDPFLDDCGVSHDDMFEEYSHAKPTKNSHHHEPGRLCDKCFRDRNGEWDCRDDFCQNCIPF
jgi:predicted transcriptional regulator